MAKLICSSIASLDGYVADERGKFDWAAWSWSSRIASHPIRGTIARGRLRGHISNTRRLPGL